MFKYGKNLGIGVKLVLSVAVVTILGVFLLIFLITEQVRANITKNTETIIEVNSKEYAAYTQGIFNETIDSTKSLSGALTEMFITASKEQFNVNHFSNVITSIFDNNKYTNFVYLYLLNPPDSFKKANELYTTKNNKFIMLYADSDPEKKAE